MIHNDELNVKIEFGLIRSYSSHTFKMPKYHLACCCMSMDNWFILKYCFRYNATIKMFRDIGDKFGLIQAQIGVAKCLAQCKRFRDSMNSYQLAVTSCHETDNKVRTILAISLRVKLSIGDHFCHQHLLCYIAL